MSIFTGEFSAFLLRFTIFSCYNKLRSDFMDFNFYMPVRVYGGKDAVLKQSDCFSQFGKRCLLVTGGKSAKLCGALADVQTVLQAQNTEYTVFDEIGRAHV